MSLDVLTLPEAVELMRRLMRRHGSDHDDAELQAICDELGCLPLAVAQAASYLSETWLSAGEYLTLLRSYPGDMLAHGGEGASARTVARVWRVTLDRLADTLLAGQILRILGWYAPDAIPRSLLDGLGAPPAVAQALAGSPSTA